MTPQERHRIIHQRLTDQFAPSFLEIIDESHQHIGHAGAQSGASHFAVSIVCAQFAGKSLIQSHRMIYEVLGDLIPSEIHALKIKASAAKKLD